MPPCWCSGREPDYMGKPFKTFGVEQTQLEELIGELLAAGSAQEARPQSERADAKRLHLALVSLKRRRVRRARYHLLQVIHFTRSPVTRSLAQRAFALVAASRTREASRILEEIYPGRELSSPL